MMGYASGRNIKEEYDSHIVCHHLEFTAIDREHIPYVIFEFHLMARKQGCSCRVSVSRGA